MHESFVEFKRAFDSIPREKLFQKIEKAGINGKFLSVLSSMYLNDCSAIKQNGYVTETFNCRVGVKQGCMLSPTLFNLFLSDLPDDLNKAPVKEDISIKGVKMRGLLYADDLAIVAKTANDLQLLLRHLEQYCSVNDLAVNINKTKVLIFNNNGHRMNKHVFLYQEERVENVKMYKYLGLTFSAFGNFSLAKQELKKIALKALFKLKKEMGSFFRSKVKVTMQLFDSLVKPILLYGSEIWGIENDEPDARNPIEAVHIKFCKLLLGTSRSSTNIACRGELGRFPLKLESKYRSIKYWTKLVAKGTPDLTYLFYNEIVEFDKKELWSFKIKNSLQKIGFGNIWAQQKNLGCIQKVQKDVKQRLQDIEFQKWLSDMFNDSGRSGNQSNKMRVYRTFKTEYKYESYLDNVTIVKHRIDFTRLRISDHNLEIEKGRYRKPYVKPQDRICLMCKREMEDEIHFLLRCPRYESIRQNFYQNIKSVGKVNHLESEKAVFKNLMSPTNEIAPKVAKFISECNKVRNTPI